MLAIKDLALLRAGHRQQPLGESMCTIGIVVHRGVRGRQTDRQAGRERGARERERYRQTDRERESERERYRQTDRER